jgi:hypothetical protein
MNVRAKSLSRHFERAPSPATNIDLLRKVLAGTSQRSTDVPKIEINGEKQMGGAVDDMPEKGDEGEGDVTTILDSLNINGAWKEKDAQSIDDGIKPPYAI